MLPRNISIHRFISKVSLSDYIIVRKLERTNAESETITNSKSGNGAGTGR